MAPGLTRLIISVRGLFMASMLTVGMTNAAPVPRTGQVGHRRSRLIRAPFGPDAGACWPNAGSVSSQR
jgi:hypothetical protein